MAKIKKYQKVESYLHQLKEQEQMSSHDMMKLHFKDLLGLPELDGIGDRTISNVLKSFKKELGVLPREEPISKRQKVRNYLDEQLQSENMDSEELMELRYQDLMERDALKGIGKTTISCALSSYKKNFEKKMFESNILSFLGQGTDSDVPPAAQRVKTTRKQKGDETDLSSSDILVLRKMVDQYEKNQMYHSEKRNLELRELKLALNFSGIDCQRILELYWKSRKDVVFPMANLIQNDSSSRYIMENA